MWVKTYDTAMLMLKKLRTGEDLWNFWSEGNGAELKPSHQPGGALMRGDESSQQGSLGNLSAMLRTAFDEKCVQQYLTDLLTASKPVYSTGNGEQKVIGETPDWATRKDALKLLLAYRDGMPLKRKEEVVSHQSSDAQVIANLANKPGYRHAMRNFIDSMDDRSRQRTEGLQATVEECEQG